MFWNGSTAIEGLSGSGSAGRSGAPSRTRNTWIFARDVLQLRRAEIIDLQRDLAGGVLADAGGNADATRLGQRLQPRRDDHAIAQQIVALCHYLALMHADAQPQAVGLGAQLLLDGDGAAQCLHGAGEGDEEAIAGGLEQPAAMRGRDRLDEVGAQRAHARQRGRLVRSDHRRIADNIGCQDAGQTAVSLTHGGLSVLAHVALPEIHRQTNRSRGVRFISASAAAGHQRLSRHHQVVR